MEPHLLGDIIGSIAPTVAEFGRIRRTCKWLAALPVEIVPYECISSGRHILAKAFYVCGGHLAAVTNGRNYYSLIHPPERLISSRVLTDGRTFGIKRDEMVVFKEPALEAAAVLRALGHRTGSINGTLPHDFDHKTAKFVSKIGTMYGSECVHINGRALAEYDDTGELSNYDFAVLDPVSVQVAVVEWDDVHHFYTAKLNADVKDVWILRR